MNYLILSPGAAGTTLLERALTVYLNASGQEYYNTQEILNGLKLENNIVKKDLELKYSQGLCEIQEILEKNSVNLVSTIIIDDIHRRQKIKQENYDNFYKFCNTHFDKILYCTRDPYEYALSWAVSHAAEIPNVYSIDERIIHHGIDKQDNVNLDFFYKKLKQYEIYQYWVLDNFPFAQEVKFENLSFDIDNELENITNSNFKIIDKFDVTLNDYSKIIYQISLKKQNQIDSIDYSKKSITGAINLYQYQLKLFKDRKLFERFPIKMNTLSDKKRRVLNFNDTVKVYNSWAKQSNMYTEITDIEIEKKVSIEELNYKIL